MLEALAQPTQSSDDSEHKTAVKWHKRLKHEKTVREDWRKDAKLAWEVYLNKEQQKDFINVAAFYPLLWSVVCTQHSAIYSNSPVPIVKPRSADRNPSHKTAADVMERGLEFIRDQTEFDECANRVVDDYLLAALGTMRVKLDAEIVETPVLDEMGGEILDDDDEPLLEPIITSQDVRPEYVPWSRFGWEPAANWDHVNWVYFRHPMTRKEITTRYGKEASFGEAGDDYSSEEAPTDREQTNYWIYEIWNKETREVIHLAEGGLEPLDIVDDPLRLAGFFPCPPPIMCNVSYDQLLPKTDYSLIQSFDEDLNRLYARARSLIEQIKAITFHDASIVELEDFTNVEDGTSISINNIIERLGGAGIDSMIIPWPIKEKVEALQNVMQQMEIRRRQVDEMMGVADINRGASNPQDGQETQKIKERWSGVRLRRKQIAVQRFIRNTFRIMGEVLVEHFTRDNLQRMTQIQIDDATWQLLQNDFSREFAIDIESDSTLAKDEFEDKQARTELLGAVTQWVQVVAPAMNQNQIPADLGKELLNIVVQPYASKSRGLDQVIDQLTTTQKQLQSMQQLQQQMQQKDQQIQQMQYALGQYSEAEEGRKNQKAQSDSMLAQAKLNESQAKLPYTQLQAGETAADTQQTQVETELLRKELATPIVPMNPFGVVG